MTTIEVVQESDSIVTVEQATQIRLRNENGEPDRAYAIEPILDGFILREITDDSKKFKAEKTN